jgi:hypothetical protein
MERSDFPNGGNRDRADDGGNRRHEGRAAPRDRDAIEHNGDDSGQHALQQRLPDDFSANARVHR